MSQLNNTVHEINVELKDVTELDKLIKFLKADPRITITNSLAKFSKTPYKYDYWYSKAKKSIKIADKDGKIFDLTNKLLKAYDKVSSV